MLEKVLKVLPFSKPTQNHHEYFPKMSTEVDSTHPFYPVLIPNTSFVTFFHFNGVPDVPKIFFFNLMKSKHYLSSGFLSEFFNKFKKVL